MVLGTSLRTALSDSYSKTKLYEMHKNYQSSLSKKRNWLETAYYCSLCVL